MADAERTNIESGFIATAVANAGGCSSKPARETCRFAHRDSRFLAKRMASHAVLSNALKNVNTPARSPHFKMKVNTVLVDVVGISGSGSLNGTCDTVLRSAGQAFFFRQGGDDCVDGPMTVKAGNDVTVEGNVTNQSAGDGNFSFDDNATITGSVHGSHDGSELIRHNLMTKTLESIQYNQRGGHEPAANRLRDQEAPLAAGHLV